MYPVNTDVNPNTAVMLLVVWFIVYSGTGVYELCSAILLLVDVCKIRPFHHCILFVSAPCNEFCPRTSTRIRTEEIVELLETGALNVIYHSSETGLSGTNSMLESNQLQQWECGQWFVPGDFGSWTWCKMDCGLYLEFPEVIKRVVVSGVRHAFCGTAVLRCCWLR